MFSLCHRPRNCNLSNLCGRCKSLAPEIVSWFLAASLNLLRLRQKARCAHLSPPAGSRTFGARASRSYLGQLPRIESLTKTNCVRCFLNLPQGVCGIRQFASNLFRMVENKIQKMTNCSNQCICAHAHIIY